MGDGYSLNDRRKKLVDRVLYQRRQIICLDEHCAARLMNDIVECLFQPLLLERAQQLRLTLVENVLLNRAF